MDPRLIEALKTVNDPELHKDLVSLGMVKAAQVVGDTARITIELTTPACPLKDQIQSDIQAALDAHVPGTKAAIEWTAQVRSGRVGGGAGKPGSFERLDAVSNIVLVASGKGGVGKSTVAVNLACALARSGCRVGLLDADIYGPSIPTMFNLHDEVSSMDGKTIEPHEFHGIKVMSMGFLIPPSRAMIWRGPMLHSAVVQFLRDVNWGELDYLVVDLPPGTGDVQLTFAQQLKVTGAVVVSTPQEVALADVVRAKAMFDSVQIPVLGLVENMAYFLCDGCDKKHFIFDRDGVKKAAEQFDMTMLGELPLEPGIREGGDSGLPVVLAQPESEVSQTFLTMAATLAGRISVLCAAEAEAAAQTPETATPAGRRALPIIG